MEYDSTQLVISASDLDILIADAEIPFVRAIGLLNKPSNEQGEYLRVCSLPTSDLHQTIAADEYQIQDLLAKIEFFENRVAVAKFQLTKHKSVLTSLKQIKSAIMRMQMKRLSDNMNVNDDSFSMI